MLDNAIHECVKVARQGRNAVIHVKLVQEGGKLIYKVYNITTAWNFSASQETAKSPPYLSATAFTFDRPVPSAGYAGSL